jgi:hypothetical protein
VVSSDNQAWRWQSSMDVAVPRYGKGPGKQILQDSVAAVGMGLPWSLPHCHFYLTPWDGLSLSWPVQLVLSHYHARLDTSGTGLILDSFTIQGYSHQIFQDFLEIVELSVKWKN